jgi:hypothetical protein
MARIFGIMSFYVVWGGKRNVKKHVLLKRTAAVWLCARSGGTPTDAQVVPKASTSFSTIWTVFLRTA